MTDARGWIRKEAATHPPLSLALVCCPSLSCLPISLYYIARREIMSLLGIAIVGKKNEPLYLCDCTKLSSDGDADDRNPVAEQEEPQDGASTTVNDPFGFLLQSTPQSSLQGQSLEMEQQFILHAALDRLEEHVGASNPDGTMPLRKAVRAMNNAAKASKPSHKTSETSTPTSSSQHARHQDPSGQWLGLLLTEDGTSVTYGYVTATNLKILVLVRGDGTGRSHPNDVPVRTLCTTLHGHYISHVLNPFQPLHGEDALLASATFDRRVREAVRTCQETLRKN